jgi:hypothetical protein
MLVIYTIDKLLEYLHLEKFPELFMVYYSHWDVAGSQRTTQY